MTSNIFCCLTGFQVCRPTSAAIAAEVGELLQNRKKITRKSRKYKKTPEMHSRFFFRKVTLLKIFSTLFPCVFRYVCWNSKKVRKVKEVVCAVRNAVTYSDTQKRTSTVLFTARRHCASTAAELLKKHTLAVSLLVLFMFFSSLRWFLWHNATGIWVMVVSKNRAAAKTVHKQLTQQCKK